MAMNCVQLWLHKAPGCVFDKRADTYILVATVRMKVCVGGIVCRQG